MASSLVVLNNSIVNQQAQSSTSNSSDSNPSGVNNNEASLVNLVGSRVSSANSSPSPLAQSNNKNSIVTIANSERTSLPPLNLSSSIKSDDAMISPKVYISTHHLKMSNNPGKENNFNHIGSFEASNSISHDRTKVTIVNSTRETSNNNSAKIKIKYNYNNFSGAPLPSPTNPTPAQFFGPLDSPNSLSNKKLANEMDTRSSPSSSSPSSPSSLVSNHSDVSNSSPIPNLGVVGVEHLDHEQHAITDVNLVMESNKLHLAIVKPNVLRRSSSFIAEESDENVAYHISKMR
jgi:hypothetical protein